MLDNLTQTKDPKPQNEIYAFMKANNLTDKDETTFLKEYSDSTKAKELYQFIKENKLTDKDFNSFYDNYLQPKPSINETELQKLHKAVSEQFDVGDFNTFKSKMQTVDARKKFFDVAGNNGADLGDYTEFEKRLSTVQPLSNNQPISETPTEPEKNIIDLAQESASLKQKGQWQGTGGTGGAGGSFTPDAEAQKQASLIDEQLKQKGIDSNQLYNEMKDFPKAALDWKITDENGKTRTPYSKEELAKLRLEDPFKYNDIINGVKNQFSIAEKTGDWTLANEYTKLKQADSLQQFAENVQKQKEIIRTVFDNKDEIETAEKRLENSESYKINPLAKGFSEEYIQSQFKNILSPDQYAGLKTLELFNPEKYKQTVSFLSTPIKDMYVHQLPTEVTKNMQAPVAVNTSFENADSTNGRLSQTTIDQKIGLEKRLRELSDIGRSNLYQTLQSQNIDLKKQIGAIQDPVIKEDLINQFNSNVAKLNAVISDADKDDARYPYTTQLKLDRQVADITSKEPGLLNTALIKFAIQADNPRKSFEELFGDNPALQMQRSGESESLSQFTYLPEKFKRINSEVTTVYPEDLKNQIQTIAADNTLSATEKQAQTKKLLLDNQSSIKTITNPNAGKSKNFFSKATAYTMAGFLGDIAGMTYTMAATPVKGNYKEILGLGLSTHSQHYTQAVEEGNSNPNEYANLHTAIDMAAAKFGTQFSAIKKMIQVNPQIEKTLAGITEETWNKVVAKDTSIIDKLTNSIAGSLKENGKMIATWGGVVPAAHSVADNAFYDKNKSAADIISESYNSMKEFAIGQIPLIIAGAYTGYKHESALNKSLLWEIGDDAANQIQRIQEYEQAGKLSPEQAFNRTETIKEVSSLIKQIPTTDAKGNLLTDDAKVDYLYNLYVKKKSLENLSGLPETMKSESEKTASFADNLNSEILNPKPEQQILNPVENKIVNENDLDQNETVKVQESRSPEMITEHNPAETFPSEENKISDLPNEIFSADSRSEDLKKRVDDFFEKLKIKEDKLFTIPIPPPLYNGFIDIVKEAVKTGIDVYEAVKKGIQYLKDNQIAETDINETEAHFLKSSGIPTKEENEQLRNFTKREVVRLIDQQNRSFNLRNVIKNSKIVKSAYEASRELANAVNPFLLDKTGEARKSAMIIRLNKGEEARQNVVADEASSNLLTFFNKNKRADNVAFMLSVEDPKQFGHNEGELHSIATAYRTRLDKSFDLIAEVKDIPYQEEYFPHFWKRPEEAKNILGKLNGKRPLEGSKYFLKKRFYENIMEGLKNGLELVTYNPEEMVRIAESNALRLNTAHQIKTDLVNAKLIKYYRPGDAPVDFVKLNDPLFQPKEETGAYYAPEQVAAVINNFTSKGLFNADGAVGSTSRTIRKYNNIKNLVQLGIGFFHFTTTSLDATVTGTANALSKILAGNKNGIPDLLKSITIVPNIFSTIKQGDSVIKDYKKGILSKEVEDLTQAGGRVQLQKMYTIDAVYSAKKAFHNYQADGKLSDAGKVLWNSLFVIPEMISHPLMQWYVPRLKVGSYLQTLKTELELKPDMTDDELLKTKQKVWSAMDDRLGQYVYDNLFWNKTVKDLGFMSVRSLGWNAGTWMAFGKGTAGLPESAKRLSKGQGLDPNSAWLISLPVVVGLYGALYQKMMTGKDPEEMKDYFFPKDGTINPDGTEHRVTLPSYIKDAAAYSKHPLVTAGHKASPFLNEFIETFNNEDFYGTKIINPEDPIYQKGLDYLEYQAKSFVPFSLRQLNNASQGAEQFLGVTSANKDFQRTDTENKIAEASRKKYGQESKTKEEADRFAARYEIKTMLRTGTDVSDIPEDLIKKAGYTSKGLGQVVEESNTPFYPLKFKHLDAEDQIRIWEDMNEDERKEYAPYLHNKSLFEKLLDKKELIKNHPEWERLIQDM